MKNKESSAGLSGKTVPLSDIPSIESWDFSQMEVAVRKMDLVRSSGLKDALETAPDREPYRHVSDPYRLMSEYSRRHRELFRAVLGPNAALLSTEQAADQQIRAFIPVLTQKVADTMRQWPELFRGNIRTPVEGVMNVLRYSAAVTDRYAAASAAVHYLQHPDASPEQVFQPFVYRLPTGTKTIRLHNLSPYIGTRDALLGPRGVPSAIRVPGVSPDLILLSKNPHQYHRDLEEMGVYRVLQLYANGGISAPPDIQNTLRTLDYILVHDEGDGISNPSAPTVERQNDPHGIALVTRKTSWITADGGIAKSYKEKYRYDPLAISHELQHVFDHKKYFAGGMIDTIVPEVRALSTERAVAVKNGWQESDEARIAKSLERFTAILTHTPWDHSHLPHGDEAQRSQCMQLLYGLPEDQLQRVIPILKQYFS